jgi:hypothetical protein
MRRRVLGLGAYLLLVHAAVAAEGDIGCAQNRAFTTDRYLDALKGNPHDFADPIFREVPSDVTMLEDSAAYILRDAAALRQLPLANSPPGGVLRTGERFNSACRVKGQAGDWWLVIKATDAALIYVPESKTEKADADDRKAGAEPEPERRSRDPLFQGKY